MALDVTVELIADSVEGRAGAPSRVAAEPRHVWHCCRTRRSTWFACRLWDVRANPGELNVRPYVALIQVPRSISVAARPLRRVMHATFPPNRSSASPRV